MHSIVPIAAFTDNYIWALHLSESHLAIVDPGCASSVLHYCQQTGTHITDILITHEHYDHTDGVQELAEQFHGVRIHMPVGMPMKTTAGTIHPVTADSLIELGSMSFMTLATPGHTASHVSYYCQKYEALFCGDTIFSAGCGFPFYSVDELYQSLSTLARLPDTTRIYAAHEYSLANLAFAHSVDPHNDTIPQTIADYQAKRTQQEPTLPSTIATEWAINPFFRCQKNDYRASMIEPISQMAAADAFSALRAQKNAFRA